MEALTDRQREVLDFIRECLDQQRPPTLREIGKRFGFKSPNGASCHVNALERRGFIGRFPGSRGIYLTKTQ